MLGVNQFGQMAFITAFVAYFILLVDWGFSLSATKQIAISRNSKLDRSIVFWETFFARLLLALIGLIVLIVLLFTIPNFQENALLFILGYLAVVGAVLAPTFYYQGIEQMGSMSVLNLLIKLLSIPCIFALVNKESDIDFAIGIQAGFIFLASAVNFAVLICSSELLWVRPNSAQIMKSLSTGWPLFLSTASISLYTNTNVVILGFVANTTAVAYFTAAQTVIRAAQGLYGPISQALFPRMSHLFHHSKDAALSLLRKVMWFQGVFALVMACILFVAAPTVVDILFGSEFDSSISVLRWLSPLLFLISLSNIFGIQAMVPLGYTNPFSRILLASGLFNIIIIIPLGYFLGADGGAIAVLATEFIVTVSMGAYLRFAEPNLFKMGT